MAVVWGLSQEARALAEDMQHNTFAFAIGRHAAQHTRVLCYESSEMTTSYYFLVHITTRTIPPVAFVVHASVSGDGLLTVACRLLREG